MSHSLKASPSSDVGDVSSEVTPSPKQRRYTTAFKLRIISQADQCSAHGETASMLRREGIYFSTLSDFRKQKARGWLDDNAEKRVKKEQLNSKVLHNLAASQRETRKLRREIEQTRTLLDLQKKVAEMLGVALKPTK